MKAFATAGILALVLFGAGCTEGTSTDSCVAGQSRACFSICNSPGQQICVGGVYSATCTPPVESCNGQDDNCDGQVDEGNVCGGNQGACAPGVTQPCLTACQSTGSQACGVDRNWAVCMPPAELCNQKDDDCDGQIDEDAVCGECTTGANEQCVTPCNTVGSRTCGNDKKWMACMPPVETCNLKDDNCNGQIDENVVEACTGGCGDGYKTCLNGQWSACTAPDPSPEVCDNKDNDCDGKTDEGDNNQPLGQACGQECGGGTQICTNGQWGECSAQPATEVCDGKDNDCDGQIDENCNCTVGATQACGESKGECNPGTQQCVNGQWSECAGANYNKPEPEKCDQLDNDCDGYTDESTPAEPIAGVGATCGTPNKNQDPQSPYQSPCTVGQNVCKDGQITCEGGYSPSTEVCDDVDNDCNGQTDEAQGAGDAAEPNDICSKAATLYFGAVEGITEGQTGTAEQFTIYPVGDSDWYRVKALEGSGFCLGDESFTFTVTLSNIPDIPNVDYDLCVWDATKENCGTLTDFNGDNVTCESLGIFKNGTTPETYTHTWAGKCFENDDKEFLIKVVNFFGVVDDQCTQPYKLTFKMTGN